MALHLGVLTSFNLIFKRGCCCAKRFFETCVNLLFTFRKVGIVFAFGGKVLSLSPGGAKQHFGETALVKYMFRVIPLLMD